MTSYSLVRIVPWFVFVFVAWIIARVLKRRILYKKSIICITFLTILLAFIPVENAFCLFKTPEKAFWYRSGENAAIVVEGLDSALVIGKENSDIVRKKNDKEYTIDQRVYKTVAFTADETTIIKIINKKGSEDYYAVIYSDELISNVEDRLNTNFVSCPFDSFTEPLVIGYIGDIFISYEVSINGRNYSLQRLQ